MPVTKNKTDPVDLNQWIMCTDEDHPTPLIQESHKLSRYSLFIIMSVMLQRRPAISFKTGGSHINILGPLFSHL